MKQSGHLNPSEETGTGDAQSLNNLNGILLNLVNLRGAPAVSIKIEKNMHPV